MIAFISKQLYLQIKAIHINNLLTVIWLQSLLPNPNNFKTDQSCPSSVDAVGVLKDTDRMNNFQNILQYILTEVGIFS